MDDRNVMHINGYETPFRKAPEGPYFYRCANPPYVTFRALDARPPHRRKSMTEHPQAEILRALADGKVIQVKRLDAPFWDDLTPCEALEHMANCVQRLRVKVATIAINGIEVRSPERTAPPEGTRYWVPTILSTVARAHEYSWGNDAIDRAFLQLGFVHLSADAAEEHRRAIILANGGTP